MDFTVEYSVLLSMHHINLKGNHKFKPHYIGPFMVFQIRVLKLTSCICLFLSKHIHYVFHVSLLKPFHSGGDG